MLTTQQAIKKYGTPNITGAGYLETIIIPYPLRIAWDLDTTGEVSNFISLDCWRIEPITNEVQIENTILEEPPF